MKTKDLIKRLQSLDPAGNLDVVIHNQDILDIDIEHSFYLGPKEVLLYDNDGKLCGAKYSDYGKKIYITSVPIDELVGDGINFNVKYEFASEAKKQVYQEKIDTTIDEHIKTRQDIEFAIFVEYIYSIYPKLDTSNVYAVCKDFFYSQLSYTNPIPEDIDANTNMSYTEKRFRQWDREIKLFVWENTLIFINKLRPPTTTENNNE